MSYMEREDTESYKLVKEKAVLFPYGTVFFCSKILYL